MSDHLERVYPPKIMFAVVNPIMGWALTTPLGRRVPDLARIDFEGRKTGREYRVVVSLHDEDGRTAALTNSGWRHNFEGGHPATIHIGGDTRPVFGTLETDPTRVADVYGKRIDELGMSQSARRLGIAIYSDEPPSHRELADFAAQEQLSVVYLDDHELPTT